MQVSFREANLRNHLRAAYVSPGNGIARVERKGQLPSNEIVRSLFDENERGSRERGENMGGWRRVAMVGKLRRKKNSCSSSILFVFLFLFLALSSPPSLLIFASLLLLVATRAMEIVVKIQRWIESSSRFRSLHSILRILNILTFRTAQTNGHTYMTMLNKFVYRMFLPTIACSLARERDGKRERVVVVLATFGNLED